MNNKIKLTFVVSDALNNDLKLQVIKDGYGLRGKSKWVTEAVEKFLALSNFPELVHYSDNMQGFQCAETVVVPRDLKQKIDAAIFTVRQSYPLSEGVQSSLLRTAIIHRLLIS